MNRHSVRKGIPWRVLMLLLVAIPGTALAQTGKLSGIITDAADGSPLPGATVVLEGTQLGASTSADGYYVIVGVTPGAYTARVSFVGYTTKAVDIRVVSDITTNLDVELSTAVVEGGEVEVIAERPVVDANQTTSRSLVTGDEIARLPVTSLQDVISRTSNSYEGFIRGSRRYETRTVIDGIDVTDALNQIAPNGTGQSYSGLVYDNTNRANQTNPSLFNLNPEGVEEVTVNTGATEARYGAASGGVVAVTLSEGRGPIRGSGSFRISPQINRPGPDSLGFYEDAADYFTERDQRLANADPAAPLFTWTADKYSSGDPEVDARGSVGGSITDAWGFFFTGQWFQTHGYEPNEFRRRLNGQLKTTYQISQNTRLSAIGIVEDRGLWGNWNNTSYSDFWRFYLEGVAQNDGGSYLGSLKLTQILSPTSFLDVQAYRTYQRSRYGYVDDDGNGFTDVGENGDFIDFTDPFNIAKYIGTGTDKSKMFYENISDGFSDTGLTLPAGNRYKAARPQPYSEDAKQATNGFKVDYSNQLTRNHYLQTGTELKLYTFDYQQVYGIDQTGSKLNGALEPFQLQDWERHPWNLALYASDRMEYAGLIVNLGLRAEFANRDMEKIVDFFHPFVRDTVQAGIVYQSVTDESGNVTVVPMLDADGNEIPRMLARNNFERGDKVGTDVFLNPSIGVSHPIGETAAMYFSYARTQQLVPFTTLYQFYDGNSSNNVFFTYQDPERAPITSNNYELGVQWEFSPGWGLDANAYMRSIENYGQANLQASNRNPEGEQTLVGNTHTFATSAGYADVRGIELTLRRNPLELAKDFRLGLTASYTFSSVEQSNFAGANTTSFTDTTAAGTTTTLPFGNAEDFRNFPQQVRGGASVLTGGYDRTHRFVLRSVASLPYDFSVGLTGNLESGFLYPKVIGADDRDRELLTGPTNYQIDLRLEKRFTFMGRYGVDAYMDVTNLTNHQNIVAYENFTADGPRVFEETGEPGQRLILKDGTSLYGPARNVYFGLRARF